MYNAPVITVEWAEPPCLLQSEPEVSSVKNIPFLSLEEKPVAMVNSQMYVWIFLTALQIYKLLILQSIC